MSVDILILGLLTGLPYGLLAVGLVLVYRASRVVNFAHGEIGAFCAAVLAILVLDHGWNFFLALAADVEGEATTNYLVELLKKYPVTLTRIAHGLPAGGGLESADELTLSAALSGRTKL